MRLRDLDAVFLGAPTEGGGHRRLPDAEGAQGILFQCPKCAEGAERAVDGGLVGVRGDPRGSEGEPSVAGNSCTRVAARSWHLCLALRMLGAATPAAPGGIRT
jgi:hypothetical protein